MTGGSTVSTQNNLSKRIGDYWNRQVMACNDCCDTENRPLLKDCACHRPEAMRWRNRYRICHIGREYAETHPRIVFLGLEDPEDTDGNGPANPFEAMEQLETQLVRKLRGTDRHRHGEILLAHDLLGLADKAIGAAVFNKVASINSHLCSLVGPGTRSTSHLLAKPDCHHAWRVVFDELEPDILVVEGKKFLWDQTRDLIKSRDWQKESIPLEVSGERAQLNRILTPRRSFLVLMLYHPSRWWSSRRQRYYLDVIMPITERLSREGVIAAR
jgi:hypothetical protein